MGYRGKLEEQNRARDLRAAGWTYTEIAAELGVSKSSVSLWCRDVEVDVEAWGARVLANRNFGARRRGPNRLQRAKVAQIEAGLDWGRHQLGQLTDRDLLVAGTALYAGEGGKTGVEISFPNSDPRMIQLFLRWLRTFFEIDEARLRVHLYLHEGLDLDAAVTFWSQVTGIPPSQFTKPYRAKADPSIRHAKHPMGCPKVRYGSAELHRKVLGLTAALLHSTVPIPG